MHDSRPEYPVEEMAFREMREQADAVLRDCEVLIQTGRLVVGVSGGPDSLALLHLLRFAIQPAWVDQGRALELVAAHLNHRFRPEADQEAEYVQQLCHEWGVPCHQQAIDMPALVREAGGSLEEMARQVRYRFLSDVAAFVGAGVVAVGHHADDQAETVLMHFLRGAGPAGLRGMHPAAPMPGAPQLILLRPLLATDRDTIEAYCFTHQLQPVQDLSNLDTTFFRNRLRHELLPVLESYNPQIRRQLLNSAAVWAADVDLLEQLRDEAWARILQAAGPDWLRFDREGWKELPLSLRRSTLRQAVWTLQQSLRDVGFAPVEQARLVVEQGLVGAQAALPGNLQLTVEYETWTLAAHGATVPFQQPAPQIDHLIDLPVPGRVALRPPWYVQAAMVPQLTVAEAKAVSDPWTVYVNAAYRQGLVVRSRQKGERFQPLGMGGQHTQVKGLMIDRKIPAGLRDHWPMVATADQPVWVVGLHLDHRARLAADGPAIELRCYQEME